jgi:hypothetical protein
MLNKQKGKKQKHQIFSLIKEEFSHWNKARTPDHFIIPMKHQSDLKKSDDIDYGL